MPAELTIVVPARNESQSLPKLLTSLNRQDYLHLPDTRVCVADANSTDGTAEMARSFPAKFPIEVLPGGLPAVGRNAGARRATTPYVLFLDADVELRDPTLLRRSVRAMQRRQLHCLTTNIVCIDGSTADRLLFGGSNVVQKLSRWAAPFATGMFMMFDRQEFQRSVRLTLASRKALGIVSPLGTPKIIIPGKYGTKAVASVFLERFCAPVPTVFGAFR